MKVPPIVRLELGSRYVFKGWSTGERRPAIRVRVEGEVVLEARYGVQHLVVVESEYGSAKGSGWYDEGSTVTISVEPTSVDLDVLRRAVFVGWRGTVTSSSPSVSVTVNAPVHAVAEWKIQYKVEVVAALAVAAAALAVIAVYLIRKRSK